MIKSTKAEQVTVLLSQNDELKSFYEEQFRASVVR